MVGSNKLDGAFNRARRSEKSGSLYRTTFMREEARREGRKLQTSNSPSSVAQLERRQPIGTMERRQECVQRQGGLRRVDKLQGNFKYQSGGRGGWRMSRGGRVACWFN